MVFNFWISVCIKLSVGDGQWIHYKAMKAWSSSFIDHSQYHCIMEKNVIWNDFKSNHKIPNQIQIKSHVFQIKSLFCKSNHYVWFNHDLNQIMIWICPSLVNSLVVAYFLAILYILQIPGTTLDDAVAESHES